MNSEHLGFIPSVLLTIVSLILILSKIATLPGSPTQNKGSDPASPAITPQTKAQSSPSQASGAITISGTIDTSIIGLSERQLRRQGLECLVSVLRSLVAWGTTTGKTPAELHTEAARTQASDDIGREAMSSNHSLDRLASSSNTEIPRQGINDVASDDPSRFESAKQRKTTLLEGIKKFNFKPHRVNGHAFVRHEFSCHLLGYSISDRDWPHSELVTQRHCAVPANHGWIGQGYDRRILGRGVR